MINTNYLNFINKNFSLPQNIHSIFWHLYAGNNFSFSNYSIYKFMIKKVSFCCLLTLMLVISARSLDAQPQWVMYNQVSSANDITFDSLNNKWVATGFNGLAKLTGNTWSFFDTINSNIPGNLVRAVVIDKRNIIWVATNKGIGRYDGVNWIKYDTATLVYVFGIVVDDNNVKWMASLGNGLIKYNDTTWTYYKMNNSGIQTNLISGIALENNIKWLSTGYDGIIKYNDTNFINYNYSNSGIPSNSVWCITVDHNGEKWMGFQTAYAARFNSINNIWTYYNNTWPGIVGGTVYNVYNDSRNVKWFGTQNGLFKFNDTTLVNCNPPVANPNSFGEFKEDKYNNVWFCGQALYVYNPNGVVTVGNNTNNIPKSFIVHQNYPNPFNNQTKIRFDVPKYSEVRIVIYDVLGKERDVILDGIYQAGKYEVSFDGSKLTSGVYFYKLVSDGFSETKRMLMIK